ncbi:hypothetical protein AVEN_151057-1 [Araneus ventricosus]|uniref:Uncharacterized protein n=1 Tax=Araneus ventricosus TaxID=182803 RepID=A0A4Y2RLJ2_ARAVE|nr:hypothetical protein AVEN_151057-1 [Araneus ventricosus]
MLIWEFHTCIVGGQCSSSKEVLSVKLEQPQQFYNERYHNWLVHHSVVLICIRGGQNSKEERSCSHAETYSIHMSICDGKALSKRLLVYTRLRGLLTSILSSVFPLNMSKLVLTYKIPVLLLLFCFFGYRLAHGTSVFSLL